MPEGSMRKWFYAGAVAGGFLLLGAAPAHADVVPGPAGGLLSGLTGDGRGAGLDPAGGLNLESPLGGSPADIKPGQNSADVTPTTDFLPTDVLPAAAGRPREAERVTDRKPVRGSALTDLSTLGGPADGPSGGGLTGGGLTGGSSGDRAARFGGALGGVVPANLLGGLIPAGLLGGGLTPDGRVAPARAPRESALFDGGLPLLGGLGGLLPANGSPRTLPATAGATPPGMPPGGTPVDPATTEPDPTLTDPTLTDPTLTDPAPVDPAGAQAGNGTNKHKSKDQPVDDPRLHEEPIDDEAGGKKRTFSAGGRPIAGEDEDFQ
jgi:hypothetical protein